MLRQPKIDKHHNNMNKRICTYVGRRSKTQIFEIGWPIFSLAKFMRKKILLYVIYILSFIHACVINFWVGSWLGEQVGIYIISTNKVLASLCIESWIYILTKYNQLIIKWINIRWWPLNSLIYLSFAKGICIKIFAWCSNFLARKYITK